MRSAAAYVSILLLGWISLPGQTSQAQTIFTDVTLSTLGNITHTGAAIADQPFQFDPDLAGRAVESVGAAGR